MEKLLFANRHSHLKGGGLASLGFHNETGVTSLCMQASKFHVTNVDFFGKTSVLCYHAIQSNHGHRFKLMLLSTKQIVITINGNLSYSIYWKFIGRK